MGNISAMNILPTNDGATRKQNNKKQIILFQEGKFTGSKKYFSDFFLLQ